MDTKQNPLPAPATSPGIYSQGRFLEDFVVGDIYRHTPGRTVTETDNTWFSLLTMNQHPLHCDAEYARTTEFKRPLVASTLTLAILVGLSVSDVSRNAVANLGWKNIRMVAPVFPGDTLYAETRVLENRASQSRPHQGIVTVSTVGKNQHGTIVCEFVRSVLMPKRPVVGGAGPASPGGQS